MPWRCPACVTEIHHQPREATPRTGVVYRCPVCRLELTFNPDSQRLVVVPIHPPDANKP